MEAIVPKEGIAYAENLREAPEAWPSLEAQMAAEESYSYARENGLFRDYRETDALAVFDAELLSLAKVDDSSLLEGNLPCLCLPASASITERLSTSNQAFKILAKAQKDDMTAEELRSLEEEVSGLHKPKLKLELPLLRSDHGADCRAFRRSFRVLSEAADVRNHRLPLDPPDPEKDEALVFPKKAHSYLKELVASVKKESLVLTKANLVYLSEQLKAVDWTPEERDRLVQEYAPYRKNRAKARLTPPLSPQPVAQEYYIPDDEEVCLVPLPSDPSSTMSTEQKEAEKALFEMEGEIWSLDPTAQVGSPSDFLPFDDSNYEDLIKPSLLESMRVELPSKPCPPGATDKESAVVDLDDLPNALETELPIANNSRNGPADEVDRELEQLEMVACEIARTEEQAERRKTAALARLSVSTTDLPVLQPAWRGVHGDARAVLDSIRQIKPDVFVPPDWPETETARALTNQSLPWCSDGMANIVETIGGGEDIITSLLALPDEAPKSVDYVWKRPGLSILQPDDSDQEDLEPLGGPTAPKQMRPLEVTRHARKKRPLLTKQQRERHGGDREALSGTESRISSRPRQAPGSQLVNTKAQRNYQTTASLVDKFMELQEPHNKRVKSADPSSATQTPVLSHGPPADKQHSESSTSTTGTSTAHAPAVLCPTLHPDVDASANPPKVVLSLELSRRSFRGIRQHLLEALPNLRFVERDYSTHNASVWMPGSVCPSKVMPPMADEADIIVSPSAAILITTMVKVRQKLGSVDVFPGRIRKISARYERLIVLISEGSKDKVETVGQMSSSDVTALAELQSFLVSLECRATASYVGGGDKTVAQWAASFICRMGDPAARQVEGLLEETETPWEVFLRRAGLNAYAAQVIPRMLSMSDGQPPSSTGRHGIAAFVKMSAEERAVRFGPLLGGRRILDSVSRELDRAWH